MIDLQQFEGLLGSLDSNIEDLDESAEKNNLADISSALYSIYEELLVLDPEELEATNGILLAILRDHLSDEDKRYYHIKYGFDLGV